MLAGNVSLNSLSNHHSPYFNGTSNSTSLFTGRSVKNWADDDPARYKMVEEIIKDGGESMMRQLVKRIVTTAQDSKDLKSAATGKNATKTVDPGRFGQPYLGRKPLKVVHNFVYTLDRDARSKHLNKGEFIRLGKSEPGLLLEILRKEDVTYKFGGNRSLLSKRVNDHKKNIELSNCFYPREDFNGTDVYKNLEIYQYKWVTASAMNLCKGIGKKAFSGEFDINIDMKNADSFTFLRMIPHGESNRFLDQFDGMGALALPPNNTESNYARWLWLGMRFESSGASPLAMKVEKHDGKHYFVVEQRADYSSFKLPSNVCEMPFEGINTPQDKAVCCKDGTMQKQDVKYLYVEELRKNMMFNVKFSVNFSDFYEESAVGLPLTTLAVNDKLVARSYGWVGNNNNDDNSNPLGYHVQFGINDANDETVVVRIKNPKFYPDKVLDLDKLADQKNIPILKIDGECKRSPIIEAIEHRYKLQGPEVMTSDWKFARVGMQAPELLTEQLTKEGDLIYTFKNQLMNETDKTNDNVELTNCFYPTFEKQRIGKNYAGLGRAARLDIATGEYLARCVQSDRNYYHGDFDIKVKMGKPGNVTVFRMIPHNSGKLYLRPTGSVDLLRPGDSRSKYLEMKDKGVIFGDVGQSPLTMNVEYYEGKHFFTIKARSNYAIFSNPNSTHCDIPFKGEDTPLGEATCCSEESEPVIKNRYLSDTQEEDVKYLHVSPLESGWFNVKFYTEFTDFGERVKYSPVAHVALSVNNKQVVARSRGVGNNNFFAMNTRNIINNGGYYPQFGISSASHDDVVVQIKNPVMVPGVHVDLEQSPFWSGGLHDSSKKINVVRECRPLEDWSFLPG